MRKDKPRLLELFCGTKSVGKIAEKYGWDVISVDIEKKFDPTHICNITDFNKKLYPIHHFEMIWASPPCTQFSLAKTVGERDIIGASKLVKCALRIIKYYKPLRWAIENPVGLLRHQRFMDKLQKYRKTVSYCKYGFLYRKNTDIWSNILFSPKICKPNFLCAYKKKHGIHQQSVQGAHYVNGIKSQQGTSKLSHRYSIPSKLIEDILLSSDLLQTTI
jgi:hypothetical protein